MRPLFYLIAIPSLLLAAAAVLVPFETLAVGDSFENGGVRVHMREVTGFPLGELTAIGEFNATPEEVFNILWDVASHDKFLPSVKLVQPVSVNATSRIDYVVLESGVPMVKDRDVVSERVIVKKTPSQIVYEFRNAKDGVGPEPVRTRVRIPLQEGRWELVAIEGGRTKATYIVRTDPGGDVPQKALKSFALKSVPKLFEAIQARIDSLKN